jgi:hypothetical protein
VLQRREQQAAATPAGETKRSEMRRISSLISSKDLERHQIVVQHRTGERLAQRTGGLGQGVLMQRRRKIKAFVVGGTDPLLPPKSTLGVQQRGQSRRRTR